MRTRTAVVAALAATALLAGACGSDDAEESSSGGGDDAADLSLVQDGQLTVCSDIPYEPFEFEEDGEKKGFDVGIVNAMGEKLGLETEFRTTLFDTIIPAMVAGDCDMVASAMTITDERKENANFTDPYFDADQSLLILTENADSYGTLADLGGQTIGVQAGTTGADYANANLPEGATIKEFESGGAMFPALIAGEIQAALQDFPVNAYRAAQDPDQLTVTESFPTGEEYGFAVSLDNEDLLEALNGALSDVRADGTYDEVFAEWFGEKK